MTSFSLPPTVQYDPPQGDPVPLLVSSPHSGTHYPRDFLERIHLPFHELQQMEDRYVNLLVDTAPAVGATLLQANFPRSLCDVNRDWRELDRTMFCPPLPEEGLLYTAKVKAGFGVIPRHVSLGRALYPDCLPSHEAKRRLFRYWQPYHDALQAELTRMRDTFGFAVLLDMHSMPPLAASHSCDVVLGDVHGQSCSPGLTDFLEEIFCHRGYSTRRNLPYAGGYISRHYGRPYEGIQAIQVELCRSRYITLSTLTPHKGFARLKADLTHILEEISLALRERRFVSDYETV